MNPGPGGADGSDGSGAAARRRRQPAGRALEALARRAGVSVSYVDQAGERRRVDDEALLGVLRALGEPIERQEDAPALLAERERSAGAGSGGAASLPALVVAWGGELAPIPLAGSRASRPRANASAAAAELVLDPLSYGPERAWDTGHARLARAGESRAGEARAGEVRAGEIHAGTRNGGPVLEATGPLPYGVHELRVALAGENRLVRVLSAPRHAGAREDYRRGGWGVFAPAYSIRDERRRPAGDLTSLRRLAEAMSRRGAGILATLPLLAELSAADGRAPGQSPYAPLSRMWWNEAYLDPARLPELAGVELPAELGGAAGRRRRAGRSGARPARADERFADLAAVGAALRPLLETAAGRVEASGGPRRTAFRRFVRERPDVIRYARFRAAIEAHGTDRSRWPAAWRAGRIPARAVPEQAVLRHTYAQWAMDDQLAGDATALQERGCGYLLDLPVGCAPTGYDPWAFPDAFATGASVGAPPDTFFSEGQDWGFPPPHPEGDRNAGYPMLRACLAQGLAHAAALRIDHVLGWSRLWWVPKGMPAGCGAYVHSRLDELLALACLESNRLHARLIGEDLGTVEPTLQRALRAHDIAGMRVAVFDLDAAPARPLEPPASVVAYVDTHDTATLAGYLGGEEIELRRSLGLLDDGAARRAGRERAAARRTIEARLRSEGLLRRGRGHAGELEILAALLEELGHSPAELVIVNLEDLWVETDPHNVPGTTSEHTNFARRFALSLAEIEADGDLLAVLERLDTARKEGSTTGGARRRRA